MAVTIKDVAREAGVATSTVSRVLSNSNKISEEKKQQVNEVIKRLNYTPNIIARGLANNKTRILAVVLADVAENLFENPFFIQAMKGISICAQKENYYIMYAFKEEGSNDNDWIKKFTESNLVDGLCLLKVTDDDECISYLKDINANFVVIGRPKEPNTMLWVDNDNYKAMEDLVEGLIEKGHKNIGFIGAKEDLNFSKDRLSGYKQGLNTANIPIIEDLIVEQSDFTEELGYTATIRILDKMIPTALVATDDLMAFGIQRALGEKGLNNIAVASFNNSPLAKYQTPPLASVDINAEKLGYYATKLLIDKLENRELDKKYYIIETELIERESIRHGKINK